jgi:signal transduction histidine kinase/streptogramin lyase
LRYRNRRSSLCNGGRFSRSSGRSDCCRYFFRLTAGNGSNNEIKVIYEDSRRILWIGTAEGLNKYNPEDDTFTSYLNNPTNPESISSSAVSSFFKDYFVYLCIATYYFLNTLNTTNIVFKTNKKKKNDSTSINNDFITSLFKSNDGIIWIGTLKGINKLNLNIQFFKRFSLLADNVVSGILDAGSDNLWLQVGVDLILFNVKSGEIINRYSNVFKNQTYSNPTHNNICLDKDSIWIATANSGLDNFNFITQKMTTYMNEPGNKNSLAGNGITAIYLDNFGILWIGTQSGLCSYNTSTKVFTQYQDDSNYPSNLRFGEVHKIYETSDHNLWFGTDSDLYMLNYKTMKVATISLDSNSNSNPDESRIFAMHQDINGLLWIGKGYGLYSYDIEKQQITSYKEDEYKPSTLILDIIVDNEGDIWMSTLRGLWKYSLSYYSYTKYSLEDGLRSDIFCKNSSYKNNHGELFFGTMNGLISFCPEDIKTDATAPIVLINKFNLIDKSIYLEEPIEDIAEIVLAYSDNSFEIGFIALDYNSPINNQYAYKLEGFDKDWIYCNAYENFTKYTNLDRGEYIFKVKAVNSDGAWNEEGDSLKISISTPFWKQWWFIFSSVVTAVILVLLAIQLRTYTLQKYYQKLEHKFEEKTSQLVQKSEQLESELIKRAEFTRALAHELKTPLTPILSSSEFLMNNVENDITLGFINNIRRGILNLEKRINELMDLAKGEVGLIKLNCDYIFVLNVIKNSILYFTPEAQRKEQSLIMDIPDTLPKIYADEDRLTQVILNLLNNASKFTRRNGTITLIAKEENENIIVKVIDTGCGIDESELEHLFEPYGKLQLKKESLSGLGLGLYLAKLFIELHGGKIWVISTKGKGSTFAFSLPIQHNNDIK